MRIGQALAVVAWLAGCGASEGPLLYAIDAGVRADAAATRDGAMPAPAGPIPADIPWQYQLVGEVNPASDAELLVIDLFESDAELISELHMRGKLAMAYISAGTYEPFRDDAALFPARVKGMRLTNYPSESWLDVRDSAVRELMAERLVLARDKGFDGIVPTSMAGYLADTGFDLTAADQLDYTAWLAGQAHALGLLVGMADDFGRAAELGPHFDWAVQFGCVAKEDCPAAAPFAAQGKPVFDVEFGGEAAVVCARARDLGVNAILKNRDLGEYRVSCR